MIPASERLSLPRLREAIGIDELRFASEEELAAAYPAFELGAVPRSVARRAIASSSIDEWPISSP